MNKSEISTSKWSELLSGKNGLRSIALAGGVMLHATDVYLATTIMPSITSELGGLSFYAWATTIYVVAAIMGSVVSSQHLALRGPRVAYRIAAVLFALGSTVSALAPNMGILLVGRFIQGIGGGLLFALSYAMIRIVFEEKLWPRAMALVSAMWGISAFSGPFIGGLFAQYGHWRSAFFTLVVIAVLLLILTENILPKKGSSNPSHQKLPLVQLLLLTLATLSISVGSITDLLSANIAGILFAAVLFGCLLWIEKKSANRLLPTGAYRITTALGATYLVIALLSIATAVEIYIPYFMQVIHGFSPLASGYLTVVIAFGWSFASISFSGFPKEKAKTLVTLGPITVLVGMIGFAILMPLTQSNQGIYFILMCICLFSIGIGVGMGWPHLLTKVLTSSAKGEEEKASASITTVQLLSTAVGTALTGLVVNSAGIIKPGGLQGAQQASLWLFALFALMPLCAVFIQVLQKRKTNQATS